MRNDDRLPMVEVRGQCPPAVPFQPAAIHVPAHLEADATAAQFITFGEVLRAFWRHKLLVGALVAACVAAGLAIAWTQVPVYQAKALIEVQGINENFLNRREIDPTVEGAADAFEPYVQTQMRLMQTDRMLGRAAGRLHLERLPEFQPKPGLLDRLRAKPGAGAAPEKGVSRQDLLAAMARRLTVRLSGDTRIIEVAFESYDPETAAAVANAVAEEYVAQNLEKRLSATQYTGKWLAGQLQELKGSLDQAEREMQQYVTSHDLLYTSEDAKDSVAEARLRQLQAALTTAQEARFQDQSRYELVSNAPVGNLSDAIDSEAIRADQSKLNDLRQKYAEARALYKPEHYKVQQIQVQIDEVQRALERERSQVLNRLHSQYEASLRREKLIWNDLKSQTGVVRTQSAHSAEYNTLRRSVDTYRKLYDSTLEKVKETELSSAIRANNVQIAESAVAPSTPVRPSKPMYAAVGMFAGMLLGVVSALHRDRRARLARMPGEMSARLGVPEFGPIPSAAIDLPYSLKTAAGRSPRTCSYRPRSYRTSVSAPPEEPGILRNWLELVTWRQPESALAESYRETLASLMHSGAGGAPQVVVFTSACAADGKTTTVTNIGIALAESGRQVLLIDADRRRPHLHEVFKRSNDWGFSDFLLEATPVRLLDLASVAVPTDIPRLHILPGGSDRSCVPNLVDNYRAAELLAAARRQFDTILIDTPPMLALSDARGLGRMADGVALVMRAERTPEHIVRAATERLRQDGTRVLGTILNNWKPSRAFGSASYERAAYGFKHASGSGRE